MDRINPTRHADLRHFVSWRRGALVPEYELVSSFFLLVVLRFLIVIVSFCFRGVLVDLLKRDRAFKAHRILVDGKFLFPRKWNYHLIIVIAGQEAHRRDHSI